MEVNLGTSPGEVNINDERYGHVDGGCTTAAVHLYDSFWVYTPRMGVVSQDREKSWRNVSQSSLGPLQILGIDWIDLFHLSPFSPCSYYNNHTLPYLSTSLSHLLPLQPLVVLCTTVFTLLLLLFFF